MAVNGLNYDGEMYRWLKSLKDLKVFVEKSLNIKGRWISPGGDVKLFKSEGEALLLNGMVLARKDLLFRAMALIII